MTHDERAGLGTAFFTRGAGPDEALLLHCSLASGRAWMPLVERLEDSLCLTAPDLPGHGRSDPWPFEGDYLVRSAEVASTFCDAPAIVIGHSFGAVVALRLAVERPEAIRALVLIEPVLFAAAEGSEAHTDHAVRFAPIGEAMDRGDREAATRRFDEMWGSGRPWERLAEGQRKAMIERIPLVMAGTPGLRHDSGDILGPGRLEAIAAPVLLIAGSQTDPVIPVIHRRLIERLPDARDVIVEGAGHMVPVTHADEVAEHVRGFLGDRLAIGRGGSALQ